MRIDTAVGRLGRLAVAAAVLTAATVLVPAAAGHADAAPSPSPSTSPSTTPSASAPSPGTSPTATSALPSPPVTTSPTAGARHPVSPRPAATPDLPAAVAYLATTTAADGAPGGTSLAQDGYYELFSGFADFGLTMDGILALAAAHSDQPALVRATTFLRTGTDGSGRSIDDYTGIGTAGVSGGALAKEALVAEVTGYDPRSFGGHDLLAALDASRCAAADAGTGCAGAGAFENAATTFSQALAVIAQLRASDDGAATTSLAYLEAQQHGDGSFSSDLPAGSDQDPDSTGMAAMALALVAADPAATGAQQAAATTAESAALAWLASDQGPDGGWTGAAGDSTNSAALALQALDLDATAYAAPIAAATAFLGGEQNGDGGFDLAVGQPGSDVRASTQVVGALVGTSFGTLTDDISMLATSPTSTAPPTTTAPTTTAPTTATPTSTAPTGTATIPPSVAPTTPVTSSDRPLAGGALPFTGADASLWAQLALLLLAIGAGLLIAGQRLRRRGSHR